MSSHINFKQVQLYLKARANGCTQETAAAKGGLSVRTGRRIEKGEHQPSRGKPRHWRTRKDPFAEVWESELVPMLERQPQLRAMTLYEYLQEKYPGKYDCSKLRTLQKRVQQWKATAGPPKEVMFEQRHQPGEMGLSDFTHFQAATMTVGGEPFKHLLYHYRLAYSGWQYVQIVQGGESFVALAQGLQNALQQSGGSPKIHRTDSLSAAYRNSTPRQSEDLTQRYQQLCAHYQMQPTRNNRGQSHENGAIESSHGHFKQRLHQALLLRGSSDFDSIQSYQDLIDSVVNKLNQRCQGKFELECKHLQPLPLHPDADYEVLGVTVTCHSTITVRCVLYTVPSQLIGHRLTIHLYHDCLIGFLVNQKVVELARVYPAHNSDKRRARSVNYRHVIHSLRRKPRAFLQYRWREDLLPNESYRRIWQQISEQFTPVEACRLIVESLYIAAVQDKEYLVALWLLGQLRSHTLTLSRLQQQFHCPPTKKSFDTSSVEQHSLSGYDQLLHHQAP
ncbi:IS21 family transposase [Cyanosarcina cf. burmensis CCALA 770]|nr:IS21 family transposase [Cyanosarcina cf. burmensis CCALA 770]